MRKVKKWLCLALALALVLGLLPPVRVAAEEPEKLQNFSITFGPEVNQFTIRFDQMEGATFYEIHLYLKEQDCYIRNPMVIYPPSDGGPVTKLFGYKGEDIPGGTYILTINAVRRLDQDLDNDGWYDEDWRKDNVYQTEFKFARQIKEKIHLKSVSISGPGLSMVPGIQDKFYMIKFSKVSAKLSKNTDYLMATGDEFYYQGTSKYDSYDLRDVPTPGETYHCSTYVWLTDLPDEPVTDVLYVDKDNFEFNADVKGFEITFDNLKLSESDVCFINFSVKYMPKKTVVLDHIETGTGSVVDGGTYYWGFPYGPKFDKTILGFSDSAVPKFEWNPCFYLDSDCDGWPVSDDNPKPGVDYYFCLYVQSDSDTYVDCSKITAEQCKVSLDGYRVTFDHATSGKVIFKARMDVDVLGGSVSLDTPEPHPGSSVRYQLGGEILQLLLRGVKLNAQWQRSWYGGNGWENVKGGVDANGHPVYQCTANDVGRELRVVLTAKGYDGCLISTPRPVTKYRCDVGVILPKLSRSGDSVRIENAKTNQEYLVSNSRKNIDGLSETDWKSARTPEADGLFEIGDSPNRMYYVYTRVKGTDVMEAGTAVASAQIYNGETVALQDLTLTVKGVDPSTGAETELERPDGRNYYCRVNDVLRVTVDPVPANATNFNGVYYNNWFSNSQAGTFYEDRACTKPLESGESYKTVYFKPTKQQNGVDINAEYTRGYNDQLHVDERLNVADSSGNCLLISAGLSRFTVKLGEKEEGVPVSTDPANASLEDVTLHLNDGTGTPPVLTIHPEDNTVDVDASEADLGAFFFNVYQKGRQIVGTFAVEVVRQEAEDLKLLPEVLYAEPGAQYELTALLLPSDADGEIQWWSSDPSVATVNHGVVSVSKSAKDGAETTVSATINGHKATSRVVIDRKVFPLKVDDVEVSEKNMRDILGDQSVSFGEYAGQPQLTLRGDIRSVGRTIENYGIDGLVISAEMNTCLSSEADNAPTVTMTRDTTLTGPGRLTVTSAETGLYAPMREGASNTLTIRDVDLNVEGYWGIAAATSENSTKLVIDHANVTVKSKSEAVCDFGGGITIKNAEIVKPEGGKISSDGKSIVDAEGNPANEVVIKAVDSGSAANPFVDVAEGAFYYNPVLWAVTHDPLITAGTSATTFAPDKTCTRAQVVTFLWRAAGQPEPKVSKNPFTDVGEPAYYYKAVLWAVENGITAGVSKDRFAPNNGCTRGQVVTFLWRAKGEPEPKTTTNPFGDVASGAFYYKAVLWAVENKVTAGLSTTAFGPAKTCTRGQIVTFLYRADSMN